MKDLTTILAAADRLAWVHEESVLVTLIKTQGSSYRKPGARMLILPGCRTIGTISGGCLESTVARHAWDTTRNGQRIVFTHESATEDDNWRPASGCHGKLFLLAEPIPAGHSHPALQILKMSREQSISTTLLHEFALQIDGTLIPGEVHQQDASNSTASTWIQNNATALFTEYIPALPHLLICGAGDDARPIANIAHNLGWQVTILDSRIRLATKERFPNAQMISSDGPSAIPALIRKNTVPLLMSHRYADDVDYLAKLHNYPLTYIGLLGPRRRTDQIISDLKAQNIHLAPSELSHIHSPAGLPLGGEGPEAIALSIIAEIQTALFPSVNEQIT